MASANSWVVVFFSICFSMAENVLQKRARTSAEKKEIITLMINYWKINSQVIDKHIVWGNISVKQLYFVLL